MKKPPLQSDFPAGLMQRPAQIDEGASQFLTVKKGFDLKAAEKLANTLKQAEPPKPRDTGK